MNRSLVSTLLGTVLLVGGCCTKMHPEDKEVKIAPADAPPAVLASFEKAYPGAKITEIEKETDDGQMHYDITYTGNDGKSHEIELDSNGKILEDH